MKGARYRSRWVALLSLYAALGAGCVRKPPPVGHPTPTVREEPPAPEGEVGLATYYANRFEGRKTASGELYRPAALTAAHPRLPFGTIVRVVRLGNGGATTGESVVVRVNDRGPYAGRGRIIDVSMAAAKKLQMVREGVVRVRVEVVERPVKRAS